MRASDGMCIVPAMCADEPRICPQCGHGDEWHALDDGCRFPFPGTLQTPPHRCPCMESRGATSPRRLTASDVQRLLDEKDE